MTEAIGGLSLLRVGTGERARAKRIATGEKVTLEPTITGGRKSYWTLNCNRRSSAEDGASVILTGRNWTAGATTAGLRRTDCCVVDRRSLATQATCLFGVLVGRVSRSSGTMILSGPPPRSSSSV